METSLTPESIDRFRLHVGALGKAASTIKAYSTDMRVFLDSTGKPELTPMEYWPQAMTWMRNSNAQKTGRRRKASLAQYARFAGWPECPAGFQLPPPAEIRANPLPGGMKDVRKILDSCADTQESLIVSLCGGMGLRIFEACSVTSKDLRYGSSELVVAGKGGHIRTLPASEHLWGLLCAASLTRDDPKAPLVSMEADEGRRTISKLGQRAGIGHVASHRLRATFATDMYERTKDILLCMKWLGHRNPTTTMEYLGINRESMRGSAPNLA